MVGTAKGAEGAPLEKPRWTIERQKRPYLKGQKGTFGKTGRTIWSFLKGPSSGKAKGNHCKDQRDITERVKWARLEGPRGHLDGQRSSTTKAEKAPPKGPKRKHWKYI